MKFENIKEIIKSIVENSVVEGQNPDKIKILLNDMYKNDTELFIRLINENDKLTVKESIEKYRDREAFYKNQDINMGMGHIHNINKSIDDIYQGIRDGLVQTIDFDRDNDGSSGMAGGLILKELIEEGQKRGVISKKTKINLIQTINGEVRGYDDLDESEVLKTNPDRIICVDHGVGNEQYMKKTLNTSNKVTSFIVIDHHNKPEGSKLSNNDKIYHVNNTLDKKSPKVSAGHISTYIFSQVGQKIMRLLNKSKEEINVMTNHADEISKFANQADLVDVSSLYLTTRKKDENAKLSNLLNAYPKFEPLINNPKLLKEAVLELDNNQDFILNEFDVLTSWAETLKDYITDKTKKINNLNKDLISHEIKGKKIGDFNSIAYLRSYLINLSSKDLLIITNREKQVLENGMKLFNRMKKLEKIIYKNMTKRKSSFIEDDFQENGIDVRVYNSKTKWPNKVVDGAFPVSYDKLLLKIKQGKNKQYNGSGRSTIGTNNLENTDAFTFKGHYKAFGVSTNINSLKDLKESLSNIKFKKSKSNNMVFDLTGNIKESTESIDYLNKIFNGDLIQNNGINIALKTDEINNFITENDKGYIVTPTSYSNTGLILKNEKKEDGKMVVFSPLGSGSYIEETIVDENETMKLNIYNSTTEMLRTISENAPEGLGTKVRTLNKVEQIFNNENFSDYTNKNNEYANNNLIEKIGSNGVFFTVDVEGEGNRLEINNSGETLKGNSPDRLTNIQVIASSIDKESGQIVKEDNIYESEDGSLYLVDPLKHNLAYVVLEKQKERTGNNKIILNKTFINKYNLTRVYNTGHDENGNYIINRSVYKTSFSTCINQKSKNLPFNSQSLTGMTNELLQKDGVSYEETDKELSDFIKKHSKDFNVKTVSAHNYVYDGTMMKYLPETIKLFDDMSIYDTTKTVAMFNKTEYYHSKITDESGKNSFVIKDSIGDYSFKTFLSSPSKTYNTLIDNKKVTKIGDNKILVTDDKKVKFVLDIDTLIYKEANPPVKYSVQNTSEKIISECGVEYHKRKPVDIKKYIDLIEDEEEPEINDYIKESFILNIDILTNYFDNYIQTQSVRKNLEYLANSDIKTKEGDTTSLYNNIFKETIEDFLSSNGELSKREETQKVKVIEKKIENKLRILIELFLKDNKDILNVSEDKYILMHLIPYIENIYFPLDDGDLKILKEKLNKKTHINKNILDRILKRFNNGAIKIGSNPHITELHVNDSDLDNGDAPLELEIMSTYLNQNLMSPLNNNFRQLRTKYTLEKGRLNSIKTRMSSIFKKQELELSGEILGIKEGDKIVRYSENMSENEHLFINKENLSIESQEDLNNNLGFLSSLNELENFINDMGNTFNKILKKLSIGLPVKDLLSKTNSVELFKSIRTKELNEDESKKLDYIQSITEKYHTYKEILECRDIKNKKEELLSTYNDDFYYSTFVKSGKSLILKNVIEFLDYKHDFYYKDKINVYPKLNKKFQKPYIFGKPRTSNSITKNEITLIKESIIKEISKYDILHNGNDLSELNNFIDSYIKSVFIITDKPKDIMHSNKSKIDFESFDEGMKSFLMNYSSIIVKSEKGKDNQKKQLNSLCTHKRF
jgi:hypothetical protein